MSDIFVLANENQLIELGTMPYTWVIIDQIGLDNSTCILVHRKFDEKDMKILDEIEAIRLSLTEAYDLFSNLDLGNVDFHDWVGGFKLQEDGKTSMWNSPHPSTFEAQSRSMKDAWTRREACLDAAREFDYAE
jgi:hypothetical protein